MNTGIPARVVLLLGAGLIAIGFSPILVRFASEAPGIVVAVWRTGFSAILLAPLVLVHERGVIRSLSLREVTLISVSGVILGLHFVAWIESLYYTSVASASVLVTTSPIFIAVLGFVFLRERLTVRTVAAILIAVSGAVLISLSDAGEGSFPRATLGNVLALTAALGFSVYLLIGRAVRQQVSLLAYLFPLYSVAALTTLVIAIFQGVYLIPSLSVLGLCLLMALGPQLLGHGSINNAVKYIPAAVIGLASLSEPVIASGLAFLFFDEVPSVVALVGMVMVLGAIGSVFLGRKRARSSFQQGDPGMT
ncbi:MAG: DMT family transporter [Rubricoccaceae bacterium]|nr:DMT family transporter [Rubricoccaceae bacterium]